MKQGKIPVFAKKYQNGELCFFYSIATLADAQLQLPEIGTIFSPLLLF